jgi:hypothetical protein
MKLIGKLIDKNTCGLILNTGKYLHPEDITDEVKGLCDEHNYPLFTMPWATHIHDITEDYYGKIFMDTESSHRMDRAFKDLIFNDGDTAHSIATLTEYGYSSSGSYTVCCLYTGNQFISNHYLRFESIMNELYGSCHILNMKDYLIIVLSAPLANHKLEKIKTVLNSFFSSDSNNFCLGIGRTVSQLNQLPLSFAYSKAAATLGLSKKETLLSYDSMGFFKLLLEISDTAALTGYMNQHLGKILEYDSLHNCNYTDTLYYYLLYNGSIQQVADKMYCHRNTINYRIKLIKEQLEFQLDDSYTRFELFTAFQIREFLNLIQDMQQVVF